jgi:hypothetical protein
MMKIGAEVCVRSALEILETIQWVQVGNIRWYQQWVLQLCGLRHMVMAAFFIKIASLMSGTEHLIVSNVMCLLRITRIPQDLLILQASLQTEHTQGCEFAENICGWGWGWQWVAKHKWSYRSKCSLWPLHLLNLGLRGPRFSQTAAHID